MGRVIMVVILCISLPALLISAGCSSTCHNLALEGSTSGPARELLDDLDQMFRSRGYYPVGERRCGLYGTMYADYARAVPPEHGTINLSAVVENMDSPDPASRFRLIVKVHGPEEDARAMALGEATSFLMHLSCEIPGISLK